MNPIDEYLKTVPEEARTALETLRQAIRAAAPEATETIAWRMPTFRQEGRLLVAMAAFKDHYSLFPMSLAVMDQFKEELADLDTTKGTIHFDFGKPLPVALVKKIVKAKMKENEAVVTGKTKRAKK